MVSYLQNKKFISSKPSEGILFLTDYFIAIVTGRGKSFFSLYISLTQNIRNENSNRFFVNPIHHKWV
jgi:hypothetical protein